MSETLSGGSRVKVNRLKDSYTWNVDVVAESSSLEDLQTAKEKALAISRELEADLDPKPEEARLPF